jgi:hypothetical protein
MRKIRVPKHRRGNIALPSRLVPLGQAPGESRTDGAHRDMDRLGRENLDQPSGAQRDVGEGVVVRQHRQDDLTGSELAESGCGLSSDASKQIPTSLAAIIGDHPITIGNEVSGESFAHSAQPDNANASNRGIYDDVLFRQRSRRRRRRATCRGSGYKW